MQTTLSQAGGRVLYTEAEVAEIFRVSPRTIRRWARSGWLSPIRICGTTRYPSSIVEIVTQNAERPDVTPGAREAVGLGGSRHAGQ